MARGETSIHSPLEDGQLACFHSLGPRTWIARMMLRPARFIHYRACEDCLFNHSSTQWLLLARKADSRQIIGANQCPVSYSFRRRLDPRQSRRAENSRHDVRSNFSLRSIARQLGRSASTISREVCRNGGLDRYRAARSDQAAWDRALRPKLLQAGLLSDPEPDSIDPAPAAMVTRTNCWLAQTHISGGTAKPAVTRDDLSQPICSSP